MKKSMIAKVAIAAAVLTVGASFANAQSVSGSPSSAVAVVGVEQMNLNSPAAATRLQAEISGFGAVDPVLLTRIAQKVGVSLATVEAAGKMMMAQGQYVTPKTLEAQFGK